MRFLSVDRKSFFRVERDRESGFLPSIPSPYLLESYKVYMQGTSKYSISVLSTFLIRTDIFFCFNCWFWRKKSAKKNPVIFWSLLLLGPTAPCVKHFSTSSSFYSLTQAQVQNLMSKPLNFRLLCYPKNL